MELARMRLRGIYAVVAALVLALVVPFVQGTVLGSQGYATAVHAISGHHDFAPLVAWTARHARADRVSRVIELVPFILLVFVPPSLRRVFFDDGDRTGYLAQYSGQAGFALYLLAGVAGILTSASASANYAAARSAAQRAAAVDGFATSYAVQTILARVLGGLLITLFMLLVSQAVVRTRAMPRWVAYVGLFVGALQGATALLFALAPAQPDTLTSGVAYFTFAFWIGAVGYYLFRMVEVTEEVEGEPAAASMDSPSLESPA